MRIVAGTLRGRTIEAPRGEDTRPTIDRVREALFSSLYSRRGGFEGAIVLDAFAGSGALGIEAISRGASQAVFYEVDASAAEVVQHNLTACGVSAAVVRKDVLAFPPTSQKPPFDLVFLDPPYAFDPVRVLSMARTLADEGALGAGAILVYEHGLQSADAVVRAAEAAVFEVVSLKKYGKTGVAMLKERS